MKKILVLFLVVIFCSAGCAKLAHLQELLTLKRYSDGQEEMDKYIEMQDENFEVLLRAVENNELDGYKDMNSIRQAFGEPILQKEVEIDGEKAIQWLYRKQTEFFNTDKVYIYFNPDGNLLKWEQVKSETKKSKE